MMNLTLTDRYNAAHHLLLEEEENYNEEVVIEASTEPFYYTCSIGYDRHGSYITWNLRYYNAFLEYKTIRHGESACDLLNRKQLLIETEYKFRQLLLKAANRNDYVAESAREQLAALS